MDFAAAGLLDGLQGEARDGRLRLLEALRDDGFTLDELQRAVSEDRLALLPLERVLGARYTATEVEEHSGLPAGLMLRIRRLGGLPEAGPDDHVFGDEDIDVARSTRLFLDAGLDEQAIAEMTRVLGEAMARVAATATGTFTAAFLRPGDTEAEVAERFARLAEQLTPALEPVLIGTFKSHLRDAIRRGILSRAELEAGQAGGEQEIAVCFADVVGFTRLGGEVDGAELGHVAGRLAEIAGEVAAPPVRLIKTIGDAAMFVSPDCTALVGVALDLVAAIEAEDLPRLRAGVAFGPALQRSGDFYGHSVNLASRVTGVARPGSVLCTQEVHDAAPEAFRWSFAGKHRLKGVAHPIPHQRARTAEGEG